MYGHLKHLDEILCKLLNRVVFCRGFLSQVVMILGSVLFGAWLFWREANDVNMRVPCRVLFQVGSHVMFTWQLAQNEVIPISNVLEEQR